MLGSAGLRLGPGHDAHHRKLAQRRPRHLAGKDHPGLRGQEPGHQGRVRAVGADRIQRRAQRQARRRLGGRPHHLPPVRRLARALQQGPSRRPRRPARHGELLRRRQVRLDRPTTARRPSACRWPRSSTASSTTRTPSTSSASRCRRPRPSSSPRSTRSRPTAPTSRWRWAPRTSGKPRPWATRTSARTTGRARKAALALIKGEQKLTDPQWVEPYADARQVEALSRRRLRGADLSGQPEPVHARPRRHLSGRLVGDRGCSTPRPSSRWAPSRRR